MKTKSLVGPKIITSINGNEINLKLMAGIIIPICRLKYAKFRPQGLSFLSTYGPKFEIGCIGNNVKNNP